jgi:hypothetical protein
MSKASKPIIEMSTAAVVNMDNDINESIPAAVVADDNNQKK